MSKELSGKRTTVSVPVEYLAIINEIKNEHRKEGIKLKSCDIIDGALKDYFEKLIIGESNE